MPVPENHLEQLAKLLTEGRLVLFVGAGLSYQANNTRDPSKKLPLWRELASEIAEYFGEDLASYNSSITDLFDAVVATRDRFDLEEAVRKAIPDDEFEPGEVHKIIAELPWFRVYTTNYDTLLSRGTKEVDLIYDEASFERLRRPTGQEPKIIHLHGTLANLHTLTGQDYELWEDQHPRATSRIVSDGLDKSFLFVGYSFSDPHFKLGILPRIKRLSEGRQHRNYAWMWNVPRAQSSLLEVRDKIQVHSINEDREWEYAFRKLLEIYYKKALPPSSSRVLIASSKESGRSESQFYRINGYKLFYYRHHEKLTRPELAKLSGVDASRIKILEKVNLKKHAGEGCFRRATLPEIRQLEDALSCRGDLEYGKDDDFLADYILYYDVHWGKGLGITDTGPRTRAVSGTKAVVFDFGGTLTKPLHERNTWERIWLSVGYNLTIAGDLHRQFTSGRISHQEWCDKTCQKLREGGFTRQKLEEIYSTIEPIDGISETFKILSDKGISIYIVSGSIRTIINNVLGSSHIYLDAVMSNVMRFDGEGLIEEIRGHDFDFQGKADFIRDVAKKKRCNEIEILFVGNSLNDVSAALSGARTLCVNPKKTDPYQSKIWNDCIPEMADLKQILDFI